MGDSAVLVDNYRYILTREWLTGKGTALFIMLNPSVADAFRNDPTIRRCISFAVRFGYQRLEVANLFAWRATKPTRLLLAPDPVGPDNDRYLRDASRRADLVIAAWGAVHRRHEGRVQEVLSILSGVPLKCLGFSKEGHPRHPLMLRREAELQPYPPQAA
jgi:hypothetical protein